eukprot:gene17234-biopygen15880
MAKISGRANQGGVYSDLAKIAGVPQILFGIPFWARFGGLSTPFEPRDRGSTACPGLQNAAKRTFQKGRDSDCDPPMFGPHSDYLLTHFLLTSDSLRTHFWLTSDSLQRHCRPTPARGGGLCHFAPRFEPRTRATSRASVGPDPHIRALEGGKVPAIWQNICGARILSPCAGPKVSLQITGPHLPAITLQRISSAQQKGRGMANTDKSVHLLRCLASDCPVGWPGEST